MVLLSVLQQGLSKRSAFSKNSAKMTDGVAGQRTHFDVVADKLYEDP